MIKVLLVPLDTKGCWEEAVWLNDLKFVTNVFKCRKTERESRDILGLP